MVELTALLSTCALVCRASSSAHRCSRATRRRPISLSCSRCPRDRVVLTFAEPDAELATVGLAEPRDRGGQEPSTGRETRYRVNSGVAP
jgi:hypothetical protein